MKLFSLTACLLLSILFCDCSRPTASETEKNSTDTVDYSKEATGIWYAKGKTNTEKRISIGDHLFHYNGKHLIMYLFAEKEFMWRTEDDYYKLKTKWEEGYLMYLPAFGRWTKLAKFDGKRFLRSKPEVWDSIPNYNRINAEEVPNYYKAVLKVRNLHDYTTKPMDQPQWRKK